MNRPRSLEMLVHDPHGNRNVQITFYPHAIPDEATPEQALDLLLADARRFVAAIKAEQYDLTIVAPTSVDVEVRDDEPDDDTIIATPGLP